MRFIKKINIIILSTIITLSCEFEKQDNIIKSDYLKDINNKNYFVYAKIAYESLNNEHCYLVEASTRCYSFIRSFPPDTLDTIIVTKDIIDKWGSIPKNLIKIINNKKVIIEKSKPYEYFLLIKNKNILDSIYYYYSKLINEKKKREFCDVRICIYLKSKDSSDVVIGICREGEITIFDRIPNENDTNYYVYKRNNNFLKFIEKTISDTSNVNFNLR